LSNSWISGFTDAEGCFSAYIYQSKSKLEYCRCRFILDQKNERNLLLQISDLFCYGKVRLRNNTNDVYRLEINMNNPFRKNFNLVVDYFKNYPLKTIKRDDFQAWCKILDIITEKKHKTIEGFERIKKLKIEMNKSTRTNVEGKPEI
jgi:LAGLIDADG endonuclease